MKDLHPENTCPACGRDGMIDIYKKENVPVHSVVLLKTRESAMHYPTGNIRLGFCPTCGFIANLAYDSHLQDYSTEYESTQAYSATFTEFSRRLAEQLIDRFDLHQKQIIEIGCGQGEFISQLCEVGDNYGIGIDPAYEADREACTSSKRVSFIKDFYSEKYSSLPTDVLICKMTLEHIPDVAQFVRMVRNSVASNPKTRVFFQIPDVTRILSEMAFWDIYYEHCSYFSLGSLGRLFRSSGFEIAGLWKDYDDQYLMIDAYPQEKSLSALYPGENDLDVLSEQVRNFRSDVKNPIAFWQRLLHDHFQQGHRVVIWGSGSKGVAFLTTLGIREEIRYTVDINPLKHGTFMAGTGQEVISPEALIAYHPDLIIVMNPIYMNEIKRTLQRLMIRCEVVCATL